MDIEIHLERVMGIFFDSPRSLLHTVAKDKKYRVLDLKTSILKAGKIWYILF